LLLVRRQLKSSKSKNKKERCNSQLIERLGGSASSRPSLPGEGTYCNGGRITREQVNQWGENEADKDEGIDVFCPPSSQKIASPLSDEGADPVAA
jgi:hypothetical protein